MGAQHQRSLFKNESEWNVIFDDFLRCLVTCEPYFMFINYTLTPFLDSALWLVAKVHIRSHSDHSPCFVLAPNVRSSFGINV